MSYHLTSFLSIPSLPQLLDAYEHKKKKKNTCKTKCSLHNICGRGQWAKSGTIAGKCQTDIYVRLTFRHFFASITITKCSKNCHAMHSSLSATNYSFKLNRSKLVAKQARKLNFTFYEQKKKKIEVMSFRSLKSLLMLFLTIQAFTLCSR